MKSLNFYLVTDTHYFEPSLGASGKEYDEYMKGEQMCLAENANIVKAVFREIANDSDADIVLIAGDLTKNGEKESHKGFIKELYKPLYLMKKASHMSQRFQKAFAFLQ